MNKQDVGVPELETNISRSVAGIVLRLLSRIPRTEWRNRIIPFPAVYKRAGYIVKLDRKTTRDVLRLLAFEDKIEIKRFHGVVLKAENQLPYSPGSQQIHPAVS